jgi:hypothetical protein
MTAIQLLLTAAISLLLFVGVQQAQKYMRDYYLPVTKEMHDAEEMSTATYAASLALGCLTAIGLLIAGVSSGVMFVLCLMALIWP